MSKIIRKASARNGDPHGAGLPRWSDLPDVPGVILREWHARTPEEVIDPEQPIIDPHHHLWDRRPRPESLEGSLSQSEIDALPKWIGRLPLCYLADDLMDDVRGGGHNVVDTVFIDSMAMYRADGGADFSVGETEFVNGIAAMAASNLYGPDARCCGAIVSYADLTLGAAVEPVLLTHRAASPRFRGIRHSHAWHESPDIGNSRTAGDTPGLLASDDFRAGFKVLDRLNLSFDCYGYYTQLGEVEDLANAFPGVSIVVNHIGGLIKKGPLAAERDGAEFIKWQRAVRSLAGCRNVVMKLGGCGMPAYGWGYEERDAPPSSAEMAAAWQPYFAELINAFGVERCMFESNFPIDKVSCSYTNLWNAFKRVTTALKLTATEKNELFHDCAARIYQIGTKI